MPAITVTVDNEFFDLLAEAIARRALDNAQMTAAAPAEPRPPAQSDPWDSSWPSAPQPPAAYPSAVPSQNPQVATGNSPAYPQQQAPAPQQQQAGTFAVSTPKGPQQWTLGRADAPACECGQPAAYVCGATNGKAWKHWRCAKGISQDTWRNKCNFSLWA